MNFRKLIFWLHLLAGVVAGVVIGVMSVTGVALAYEKQLIAWAERDIRRVTPPHAAAKPLPLDELLAKAGAKLPGTRPGTIIIDADPRLAVHVSFSRTNSLYLDPYTAGARAPGAKGLRSFLQTMLVWHRYLATEGERRPLGKAVTGACNAAFLGLAVTGLYLWWPRQWSRRALAAITRFNFKLSGRARDFNWHNVIGLWSAPVLIVLTATAMPISYRWAGNLIHTLTGTSAPAPAAPVQLAPAPPGAVLLPPGALLEAVQKAVPRWRQITLRPGATSPAGGAQPVTATVKERAGWPLFAAVQLTLDPRTGEVLRRESFADLNTGMKVRRWTRFLHTGEALGLVGQGVAGLASLGGALLVWTGFALAWRRFRSWRQPGRGATDAGSQLPGVGSGDTQVPG